MFDKARINLKCPGCGHSRAEALAWVKANDEFTCTGCGGMVRLSHDSLGIALQKAEDIVGRFRRQMRKRSNKR